MIYLYTYLGVAALLTLFFWNWLCYAEKTDAENPLVRCTMSFSSYEFDSFDYVATMAFASIWPLMLVGPVFRYIATLPVRLALRSRR
jgi:hypothetical protein